MGSPFEGSPRAGAAEYVHRGGMFIFITLIIKYLQKIFHIELKF